MKNILNRLINNHQQAIGYLANLLAVGSAVFAVISWVMLQMNVWIVAGIAWVACMMFAVRIYAQNQRIAELNSALNLSVKTHIELLEVSFLDSIERMRESGEIPITETAALLQTCKDINQQLGKGEEAQARINHALAQLAEYERRVKK